MNTLTLDENVRTMLAEANEKAAGVGMHAAVTILIDCFGILACRTGFFPEYLEAECYINYMHEKQQELKYPHLCFIDGHMIIGGYTEAEKKEIEAV